MFILEVVKTLSQNSVAYAVAGGYAVALHGAVRGTVDIDIVLALTLDNYEKCEKALKSIGMQPKLPVSAKDVFHFRTEYISKRNLKAWSFYDPKDPSRMVDIIITYTKKKIPIKTVHVEGNKIPVLAKNELIKMKRLSGRPQDMEDIKALEKIQ